MYFKLLLLLTCVLGDTVLNVQCTCSQIMNENDCLTASCKYINDTCTDGTIETYCQSGCPKTGCAYYNSTCEVFAGCSAYIGATNTICQAISSKCISDGTNCAAIGDCSGYKTSTVCSFDSNNNECYWDSTTDSTNPTCKTVATCDKLSTSLTTDSACRKLISTCTVASSGKGCVDSGLQCSDQTIEGQCITNLDQTVICKWNSTNKICYDYICSNGNGTTYQECQTYKSTCTLSETKSSCQDLLDCTLYLSSETCQIGINGKCLWQNNTCVDYICSQASDLYTLHSLCVSFLSTCTIDDDGYGCKSKEADCKNYINANQCVTDSSGNKCYYNSQNQCVYLNCDNADVTSYTSSNCNMFLNICTVNSNKSKCITKTCDQALTQTVCNNLSGCIWQNSECSTYTCSSASTSYTTNSECETYLKGCITNGAGCTSPGECTIYITSDACTTNQSGGQCIWSNSACKLESCTDLTEITYSACNSSMSTCTTNGTNCISIQTCSSYTSQVSCVLGTDGPCLWISGICYQFNDCTSYIQTTFSECQLASTKCTTDGTTCIAITTCANTNTTGCYLGIDGQCVRNLNTSSQTVCEVFKSCSQLNYTTHAQCYRENNTCTLSTSKTVCMNLQTTCSSYTIIENCQVNSTGQICQWDSDSSQCRDQVCTDIIKTTYADCQLANSTCATDSSKCIEMLACASYTTQASCKIGTDGTCLYDSVNLKCRLKLCSDITDIKSCTTLTNCLADVTNCVAIGTCSSYTTSTSCAFDATDGICTWSDSACKVMTACEDANSFEAGCKKKSSVCKWTPKPSNGGSSSCKAYTCQSKNSGSTCSPLITFSGTQYQVCAELQLTCQSASINDLTEDTCFTNSAYTYYWDTVSNKCLACNGTATTNNTQTSSFTYQSSIIFILILIYIL